MSNQEICRKLVEREVVYCVSSLVSELAGKEEYYDDLSPVLSQDNYLEPSLWFCDNDISHVDAMNYLINIEGSMPGTGPAKSQLKRWLKENPDQVQDFAQEWGIDPDQNEALEHWIVTDWFSRKLEEKGEMVTEFMGLTIWGRTTSGQAIYIDGVIEEIASDMEILEGQAHEWKL